MRVPINYACLVVSKYCVEGVVRDRDLVAEKKTPIYFPWLVIRENVRYTLLSTSHWYLIQFLLLTDNRYSVTATHTRIVLVSREPAVFFFISRSSHRK